MNRSIAILSILVLLTACSTPDPQYIYINNTIKEIQIINNTECAEVICKEQICKCQKEKECAVCDNSKFQKSQLQLGRMVSELNYIKNLTFTNLMNSSYEDLQHNYTACREEKEGMYDLLKEINNTMGLE